MAASGSSGMSRSDGDVEDLSALPSCYRVSCSYRSAMGMELGTMPCFGVMIDTLSPPTNWIGESLSSVHLCPARSRLSWVSRINVSKAYEVVAHSCPRVFTALYT